MRIYQWASASEGRLQVRPRVKPGWDPRSQRHIAASPPVHVQFHGTKFSTDDPALMHAIESSVPYRRGLIRCISGKPRAPRFDVFSPPARPVPFSDLASLLLEPIDEERILYDAFRMPEPCDELRGNPAGCP